MNFSLLLLIAFVAVKVMVCFLKNIKNPKKMVLTTLVYCILFYSDTGNNIIGLVTAVILYLRKPIKIISTMTMFYLFHDPPHSIECMTTSEKVHPFGLVSPLGCSPGCDIRIFQSCWIWKTLELILKIIPFGPRECPVFLVVRRLL